MGEWACPICVSSSSSRFVRFLRVKVATHTALRLVIMNEETKKGPIMSTLFNVLGSIYFLVGLIVGLVKVRAAIRALRRSPPSARRA